MTVIDQLKADDVALKAVVDQVVAKFADLSKALSDALAANDPVALAAVAADMEAVTVALQALVPAPAPAA